MKEKIYVTYTIEAVYEEDTTELLSTVDNRIREDFARIETRADNVLPEYTTNLKILHTGTT